MNPGDLSLERWRELCAMAPRSMRKAIASDEMPAALARALPGLEWSAHPHLSGFDERPSSMLIGSLWFENGRSATLVYGCSLYGMPWSEQLSGPWPTSIGIASRVGDEGRLWMCAAFDALASSPEVAGSEVVFDGDGGCLELGRLTAIVETGRAGEAIKAIKAIQAMPSAWDEPIQQALWSLARSGDWAGVEKELSKEPRWACQAWGKGSSLPALCLRLGDWKSLASVVRAARGEARPAELGAECSRALAAFCKEACPHWPLGAAPRALAKAWGAGAHLDLAAWVGSFGSSASSKRAAAEAWARGESKSIGEGSVQSERSGARSL